MLKRRTYQQALWKHFFVTVFPQKPFPHSTAPVEKFWAAENLRVRLRTFLASPRKVPKEGDQRGATKMRPLWKPPPHRRPVSKNVPIFEHLQLKSLQACFPVDTRKSGHFRVSGRNAAGGVHRGGRFFVAPPLWRILWLLSWRDKKVTLPQPDIKDSY